MRAVLVRSASAVFVVALVVVAAIGGVSLGGSGLVGVVLAAVVAGCLGAGIARDSDVADPRQAAVDAGWRTGVGTVAVLLVLSGCAVLAGPTMTALLALGILGGTLLWWWLRWRDRAAGGAAVAPVVPLVATGEVPVRHLSVQDLGREWLRTSAALQQVRGAAARQTLVERRREALDELERRDPAGFARWLAGGATVDSDPARYVSGDPAAGYDAA